MSSEKTPEQLQRAMRQNVEQWSQLDDAEKRIAAYAFMTGLRELNKSPEEAKALTRELARLGKESVSAIGKRYSEWGMSKIESLADEPYADPWETACRVRTNLEIFNQLFGDACGKIDLHEIAEWMEEGKESTVPINDEKFPMDVPKSHWWWGREGVS